jgi:hypothetical protein
MVSVLASSAVDRVVEFRSSQTKDSLIGMLCFSVKHTALRRRSKGWLARNQDNTCDTKSYDKGLMHNLQNEIRF